MLLGQQVAAFGRQRVAELFADVLGHLLSPFAFYYQQFVAYSPCRPGRCRAGLLYQVVLQVVYGVGVRVEWPHVAVEFHVFYTVQAEAVKLVHVVGEEVAWLR